MKKTCGQKLLFNAKICANKAISSGYYLLTLEFSGEPAKAFSTVLPGQFVEIDLSKTALPDKNRISEDLRNKSGRQIILRRPFSFSDVRCADGVVQLDILYQVVGPATLRMTTLSKDEQLSVIGPLGNGFSISENKKLILLVAGGMGFPPLLHLAGYLAANHPEFKIVVFAGAQKADDLPFEMDKGKIERFAKLGIESYITTDDGSEGFKGFVTEYVDKWLEKELVTSDETVIYSCGPEPMLAAIAKVAEKYNIDCQVSMERRMACGIGLCQSCAVEVKVAGQNETAYKLCCKDGPVFNSKEVVFG